MTLTFVLRSIKVASTIALHSTLNISETVNLYCIKGALVLFVLVSFFGYVC